VLLFLFLNKVVKTEKNGNEKITVKNGTETETEKYFTT